MNKVRFTMKLIDDGTLDTVFECEGCGAWERYNYAAGTLECELGIHEGIHDVFFDDCTDECYDAFGAWARDDAECNHICNDDEESEE